MLAIIELLVQDIKDPKTLLLRAGTILLLILSYWVVSYQTEILEGFKNLSTETVLQKQADLRDKTFPSQARQEAISILVSMSQDQVVIWEYEPQFLNNLISIRASEGTLPLKVDQLNNFGVDKSSLMYLNHLQDKSIAGSLVESKNSDSWQSQPLPYPIKFLIDQGQNYFFQSPIYDLSGVYAGVILVLWKDPPKVSKHLDEQNLIQYFDSRVQQPRRSLERQK